MMAADGPSLKGRIVIQQCLSARVQIRPTEEVEAKYVEINKGVIIYVCFLKGADMTVVEKMAKTMMNVRLSSQENGKFVSVLDLPGDVLIVPQSTLGGKAKGRMMQYHLNIAKEQGVELYHAFIKSCQEILGNCPRWKEADCTLRHGTYGYLQEVLRIDTNSPLSHYFEF